MSVAGLYEILPLVRGGSVGQGAVGVGVSIAGTIYGQHALTESDTSPQIGVSVSSHTAVFSIRTEV